MSISAYIENVIEKSAWVGELFGLGRQLKAQYGAQNVFDFTVGNPYLPPPPAFSENLRKIVAGKTPGLHEYTPNNGLPETRQAIAAYLSGEYGTTLKAGDILLTCGASGALNVALKTLLNPGEEVLTPSPCFLEYHHYTANHGGILIPVETTTTFDLDWTKLAAAITPRTKVFLLNSPNNPTGKIYAAGQLERLSELLTAKSREYGNTIYLINDEPYRKIIFGNNKVPSIFDYYPHSLVVNSHSKDLSIPGERIGWAALNPRADAHTMIMQGMSIANRILGYINAPGLMQHVIRDLQGVCVDIGYYEKNCNLLCSELAKIGYQLQPPQGAFYLFPRAPGSSGMQFTEKLRQQMILTIPGEVFNAPAYFRIAFCTDRENIRRAIPGFKRAFEAAGSSSQA